MNEITERFNRLSRGRSIVSKRRRFVQRRKAGGGGVSLSVTAVRAAGQASSTNTGPINFTVTFSAPATGFINTDVSFVGSTVGGTLAAAVTGTNPYNIAVTGMTGNGVVVVSIPNAAATDATGTPFPASGTATVTFDTTAPTVTINKAASQLDPTTSPMINFDVVFSEAVTGFTAADISFTGSTVTGTLSGVIVGSGATYTVFTNGATGAGNVVASIPAGAATDAAGNTSAASTSSDNVVAFNPGGDPFATLDGRLGAPIGPPQYPTLLNSYAVRPLWMVAGVDYAVGYPTGAVLKDPSTIVAAGTSINTTTRQVFITGAGVTLDAYDFSLNNGWQIRVDAANFTVTNSKFAIGSNNQMCIDGTNNGTNIRIAYCVLDGQGHNAGDGCIINSDAGNLTIEYCWIKNSGSDMIQWSPDSGTLLLRWSALANGGIWPIAADDIHGDYIQSVSTGVITYTTKFCLALQNVAGGTNGQGFMAEPQPGANIQGVELGNCTIVSALDGGSKVITYWIGINTSLLSGAATVHDNYMDLTGSGFAPGSLDGFAAGGSRGGPDDGFPLTTYTGNINMVTGLAISNDTGPPPLVTATDNFNRANGGLGSNWGTDRDPINIVSNQAKATSGNSVAFRTAETFAANQFAQVVWQGGLNNGAGPVVRHNGSSPGSYYVAFLNAATEALNIYSVTAGSYSSIGLAGSVTIANGDVLRLEASGTTIRALLNGVERLSATNSDRASGRPGFEIFNTTVALDDWGGGEL